MYSTVFASIKNIETLPYNKMIMNLIVMLLLLITYEIELAN